MGNKEYLRALVKDEVECKDNEHGTTAILSEAFETEYVDFSNRDNVVAMVAYAVQTAEGLKSLIEENCDLNNPIADGDTNVDIYLSLAALACEIYMKAIIYHNGANDGKAIKKHRLDELFKLLETPIQSQITNKTGITKELLHTIGETFIELRYVFELNYTDKEYLFLFDLMNALQEVSESLSIVRRPLLRCWPGIVRID